MTDEFQAMIKGAARDFKKATGQKLHVNSALRDQNTQSQLYQAWVESGGTKDRPTVNTRFGTLSKPAQIVGNHGHGRAMDSPSVQVSKMKALGLFEKYGLQEVSNDPPHMQRPNR